MPQRLRISQKPTPAMSVHRIALDDECLVYVICADKKISYPQGKSHIAYIGTTKRGVARVAESAAYRSTKILQMHGVKAFDVRIVTCRRRQGIKGGTWRLLERALLITFKNRFGEVPTCNSVGKGMELGNEHEHFRSERLSRVISDLSEAGFVSRSEEIVDTIDDAIEDDTDFAA
jgi:hypothetical protein